MLKKIIRDAIVSHMTPNNLFFMHIYQHGFMASKSCVTKLLEFLEYLTEALDQDKDLDIIYLVDFCKAFDKVSHKRLLKSCIIMVLPVKFISWSKKFYQEENKGLL